MANPVISAPLLGTTYACPNLIRRGDPHVLTGVVPQNPPTGTRAQIYDRRDDAANTSCRNGRGEIVTGSGDGWVDLVDAYLFDASFEDAATVEIVVNAQFRTNRARRHARRYAKVISRLPKAVRSGLARVWIHRGNCDFGGNADHLVIHTGRGREYRRSDNLAETILHELVHVSLDGLGATEEWAAAQAADGAYVTQYALDNPTREDFAESFLAWFAVRYCEDRLTETEAGRNTADAILGGILNRLAYFDGLELDMSPIPPPRRGPPG